MPMQDISEGIVFSSISSLKAEGSHFKRSKDPSFCCFKFIGLFTLRKMTEISL